MPLKAPLYAKILGWFLVNAALVALALWLVFRAQYDGDDWLLSGAAEQRVDALAALAQNELMDAPAAGWDAILERLGTVHDIRLSVYADDFQLVAGPDLRPPEELRKRVPAGPPEGARRPPGPGFPGAPEFDLPPPPPAMPLEEAPKHLVRADGRHWLVVRLHKLSRNAGRRARLSLVGELPSLSAGGLVVDLRPWITAAGGALAFSALLWLPFVRSLTRALRRTAETTARIADGELDARARVARRDEIGQLAESVNRMAGRLEGFVNGQKRFLGDVAHELCAPLARIQLALGILEEKTHSSGEDPHLRDLREEVQHLSALVNELLSFSKAGLRPRDVRLQPVPLAELAAKVVRRELAADAARIDIPADLRALAEPELLARALANVVRNAMRHAGADGPFEITARASAGRVELSVADRGPGVPEEALPRLFDPFYRVDASRDRETGGVGLGLAIVKTCLDACQGTVAARNRAPRGLEVVFSLAAEV